MAVTLMMVTTGCNPAWISEAQGIVTTVVTIIGSITSILGLFGAAVSPTVIADINQGAEDVNAELSTVGPLITQYEATPSTGILSSIVNALTIAQTKLTALLTGVQITNAALQTKIGEVITLALNALKEGLALIPAPNASKAQLEEHRIKAAVFFESSPAKKLKQAYNTILATPTHDAEVDAVFAKVKHL
jgi:hypothetical protein